MAVLRNQRTYPLALKADPLNTGIVAAYDWASEDGSTTADNGQDHSGAAHHLTLAGQPSIVQTSGGKGRDTSLGGTTATSYRAAGAVTVGLDVGTGDFTIHRRIRMPTYMPDVNSVGRKIYRLTDSVGEKVLINLGQVAAVGWRWVVLIGGATLVSWNAAGNPTIAPGAVTDLHIVRASGTVKIYVDGALVATVANSTALLSTTGGSATIIGNYGTGETAVDAVIIDDVYWNRALTGTEVSSHSMNPYSYYENQAAANSITISDPVSGATAGTDMAVAGSYAGADSPTAIEASFNGGAWAVIDSTLADGTFSGTLNAQTAGTGSLSVRWANKPEITATVTNVTAAAASIALTAPSTQQSVVSHRVFQRDSQNNAVVRISGTYTGNPTAIQYKWNSGAWATLGGTMAAGVFDGTVTLQGLGQGDLDVRFANATGVTAKLLKVGVGDVFIVAGQSNHCGESPIYMAPAAPSGHPDWKSILCAKDGNWKPHLETNEAVFDDRTNALFAVQNSGANTGGSYFGALATKIMAAGVPVAFVPCALGSSSLAMWAVSESTGSLYGAALARAARVGDYKALLWWQGEAEAEGADTQAQLVTKINALVDGWYSRTGKKWFIWAIDGSETAPNFQAIHDALIEVGQTNPNCAGSADLLGAITSGIHYETGPEISEIANRTYTALNAAYSYSEVTPPADTTAPVLTGAITESNVTESGFTFAWPAATGDVVGYDSSIDGGATWLDVGNVLTRTVGSRPASTAHGCRVRAYDGATPRNLSAELSRTITTLAATAPAPTVTGVSVSPTTASGSRTFTASVSGTNSPSQAVTWAASAGSITTAGVFTAPAATTSEQIITITARSVADATKTGTATVTIAATGAPVEGVQVGPSCTVNFGGTNRQLAGDPSFKNNKWSVPKDPDDKRWYKFGLAKDATEAGTTISTATAIFDGVTVEVPPAIQGTDVVVKLGGFDLTVNAENFCTIRALFANGEQVDRTMHFIREDH